MSILSPIGYVLFGAILGHFLGDWIIAKIKGWFGQPPALG
jgi:hypothetical protein